MEINEICRQGEIFISELGKYYLLGGMGNKSDYSLKDIYKQYGEIFTYDNIKLTKNQLSTSNKRRFLLSFLVQGYIGSKIFDRTQEIVNTELQTLVTINKRSISLRYAMQLIPTEKSRSERLKLDKLLGEKQDRLNPLREKRIDELKKIANSIGYNSYIELIEEITDTDLEKMRKMAEEFLESTEDTYTGLLNRLEDAFLKDEEKSLTKSDIAYIFKSNPFDSFFPEIELIPTIEDTLFGMGINIHDQSNITLSFEKEKGKAPKPFCCPVNIPEEIHLVFNPKGGVEDYQTSLHEAGHSQHYAFMEKDLNFEYKRLGDKSVGEGYGFLFQNLMTNIRWVEKFLDVEKMDVEKYEVFINGYNLYLLRRFCGKLIYELEIFAQHKGKTSLREKYVSIMERAVKVKVNSNNYLLDLDLGFNTPNYLRAWILESYLRKYLLTSCGESWFNNKKSGEILINLWKKGNTFTAEEIARTLGYNSFNMDLIKEQFIK